jgi:ADP-ribosylglycohydrolase
LKIISSYFAKEIPKEINDCVALDYNSLGSEYPFQISGYSLDTLGIALWSWQTLNDFATSIKKVITLGNDTDTFASVTGTIVGCYYGYNGIPEKWKEKIINKELIKKTAETLYDKKYIE